MSSNTLLSAHQRKFAAAAITTLSVVALLATALLLFFILQWVVGVFSNVIWPLAIAGILTVLVRPIVVFFENKLKLGRLSAIWLMYFLVISLVAGIGLIVIPLIVHQAIGLIQSLPDLYDHVVQLILQGSSKLKTLLGDHWDNAHLQNLMNNAAEALRNLATSSVSLMKKTGGHIFSFLGWIPGAAIIPVYLFYLLDMNRDFSYDIRRELVFLQENWRNDLAMLSSEFASILVAFFRGQLIIGFAMGCCYSIGFLATGLSFSILLGLLLGLLNIVPYFGTILGLLTVLPMAYYQVGGGILMLSLNLAVFAIVQLIEGYLLTPRIMGQQTGLHPMAIIISLFFWGTALDSIIGLVLAIPLTAFFVVVWRLLKLKYLNQLYTPSPAT